MKNLILGYKKQTTGGLVRKTKFHLWHTEIVKI